MTYIALADECNIGTDDRSHNSYELMTLRNNIADINDERSVVTSVAFARPLRLCAVNKTALGPFWIYLGEPTTSLTTTVTTQKIDFENAPSGSDSLYVWVGAGNHNSIQDPPNRIDEWTVLTQSAVQGNHIFTVPLTGQQQHGWTSVYVWYHSVVSGTVASDVVEEFRLGLDGIVLPLFSPTPSTAAPPERAITLVSGSETFGTRIIGRYTSSRHVFAIPKFDVMTLDASTTSWTMQNLGVMALEGISIQQNAPDFVPLASSFYTNTPVKWQTHQRLVQNLNNLVTQRTPTQCAYPGYEWLQYPGSIRAEGATVGYARVDHTDWRALARAFIPADTISGITGYRVMVSIAGMRAANTSIAVIPGSILNPNLQLRLVAYGTVGGAAVATSDTFNASDFRAMQMLTTQLRDADGYNFIKHNMIGSTRHVGWQAKGQLSGLVDPTEDIRRLYHAELFIPIDEIAGNYPIDLVVEATMEPLFAFPVVSLPTVIQVFGFGVAATKSALEE
jgi:hypothetical protein